MTIEPGRDTWLAQVESLCNPGLWDALSGDFCPYFGYNMSFDVHVIFISDFR